MNLRLAEKEEQYDLIPCQSLKAKEDHCICYWMKLHNVCIEYIYKQETLTHALKIKYKDKN